MHPPAGAASQEFVLLEVHPLDDVAAVIEHPADVLRVHSAGEVRVAVVLAVPSCRADPLQKKRCLLYGALHTSPPLSSFFEKNLDQRLEGLWWCLV